MKKRIAILSLICLLILCSFSLAQADHVYVSFSVALGGVAVGAVGVGFFSSSPRRGRGRRLRPLCRLDC